MSVNKVNVFMLYPTRERKENARFICVREHSPSFTDIHQETKNPEGRLKRRG